MDVAGVIWMTVFGVIIGAAVLAGGIFLLGLFGLTLSRVKHAEELRQADLEAEELRRSNPEYNYDVDDLGGGTIKLIHAVSDATALFDPDKKVLHLKSEELGNRTEDCQSEEDAGMAFEDFLRGLYDPR